VEINEWYPSLHREAQSQGLMVIGIGPTISISQEAVRSHRVIIGWLFSFDDRHSGDAEWDLSKKAWLEDSLRTEKRHALSFMNESLLEELTRDGTVVWKEAQLFFEEPKRRKADGSVSGVHWCPHSMCRRPEYG
jgi:hypothetical protein